MASKFGTSGLRGLVPDLLSGDGARHVGAFCVWLRESGQIAQDGQVAIAWDLRSSSPVLADICRRTVESQGLDPLLLGEVSTPALALFSITRRIPALMVTGSHIPADRNGIKFYRPDGEISKADEAEIVGRIASVLDDIPAAHSEAAFDAGLQAEARVAYLERYRTLFETPPLRGLRIGIYEHSSVSRDHLHSLFAELGAETVSLGRSTVFVPVDTEAVSAQTQQNLSQWAQAEPCFAFVSTDGDGDRPLLADETGKTVRGDVLGLLAARFLAANTIVTPVTSSSGIEKAGSWVVHRTRVGSPFVIDEMQRHAPGGVVGFEANGGVLIDGPFFVDGRPLAPLPTRDSFLPLLASCILAARAGQRISQYVRDLGLPATVSNRIEDFAEEKSKVLLEAVERDEAARVDLLDGFAPMLSLDPTDGLKMRLADESTVHLRASGNAPELRCYVEAAAEEQARQMLTVCLERLARHR